MNKFLLSFLATAILILAPQALFADGKKLDYINIRTDLDIWKIDLKYADWANDYSKSFWNGFEVKLDNTLDDTLAAKTSSYTKNAVIQGVDFTKMRDYLQKKVGRTVNRTKQDVTIDLDKDGKVTFEGFAITGQEIDFEKAFYLIKKAYEINDTDTYVRIPIKTKPPEIIIKNDELKKKGIKNLIGTGETDFTGSPSNRKNNIRVGLDSFNGKLVPPDKITGAGEILGQPIDGTTGYKKELVIKGDKTVPGYGGGLCQVSTTVYRSVLFAGLPITQRRNHSYAVSYYDPQGLDATIYPPTVDIKFKNDTSGHILIQTKVDGNKAYSNIYGTPVDRQVNLVGPYYYNYRSVPPPRTEYTSNLKPGETKKLGEAHKGFQASWYRIISSGGKDKIEHIYSDYEARPKYTLIGKEEEKKASEEGT